MLVEASIDPSARGHGYLGPLTVKFFITGWFLFQGEPAVLEGVLWRDECHDCRTD